MKTSQNGLKIIMDHEGLASKIPNVDFSKNTHKLSQVLLSQKDIANNVPVYSYKCSAGKSTIGWGCRVDNDKGEPLYKDDFSKSITIKRCEELLKHKIEEFENAINQDSELIKAINGNQNKFDALICLIFNIGCHAFAKSTVRKCIIKNESKEAISEAWRKWNKVKKKENPGLTKRRKHEVGLFFSIMTTKTVKKETSWFNSLCESIDANKLIDLGIDATIGSLPFGNIITSPVKSLVNNLLGKDEKEDITPEEFTQAIENASPEQLSNLKELLAQVNIEKEKTQQAIEKTLQEKEDTKQSEHQVIMTQIKEISHTERVESRKWFLVVLLINVLAYIGLEVIEQSWNIKIDLYNKTMLSLFSVFSILTFHEIMHPKVGAVIDTWLSIITLVFQVPNTLLNGVNNGLTGIGNFVKRK
jgi:GH24 family phage-related lysozyme (muramidase)